MTSVTDYSMMARVAVWVVARVVVCPVSRRLKPPSLEPVHTAANFVGLEVV